MGRFGGEPGFNGHTELTRGGISEPIGVIKVLTMQEGDTLLMTSPCGGGFGPPRLRDPSLVFRDVQDELLAIEQASEVYGVSISNGEIDDERTSILRSTMERASDQGVFAPGAEQRRYEAIWSVEASIALSVSVMRVPLGVRRIVLDRSRGDLSAGDQPIDAASARRVVEDHAKRLQKADIR